METKTCKCGKSLPSNYKYRYCESCRGKKIEGAKKVGKGVLAGLAVVGTALVTIATVVAGSNKNSSDK